MVVVIYSGWYLYRLSRPVWQSLAASTDTVVMRHHSGDTFTIASEDGAFVSPLYIGFRCQNQSSDHAYSVGIFRGQVDDETFRRLSVFLRRPNTP